MGGWGQQAVLAVSRAGLAGVARAGPSGWRLAGSWVPGGSRVLGTVFSELVASRWEVSDGNQTGREFLGTGGWCELR